MGSRFVVLLLAIAQVLVTFLPYLGYGAPIGDQSDGSRTLITPIGWTFSVWGPLYFGAIAYAVYQALPAQRDNTLFRRIRWASAGAFAGNAAWALYTQFYALTAPSVVIILFTLLCLLAIFRTLAVWPRDFTPGERYLAALPLSALGGWLTAATIVNIAATLTLYRVSLPLDPAPVAAAIVAVGGIIVTAAVLRGAGNPWYALTFLWALTGIYAAWGSTYRPIGLSAIGAGLIVIVAVATQLARPSNRRRWFG
ncbi:MAG: hypothetical protein EOP61_37715 [Sphingomonadales bacterium]|nr:MAG: hypothetical protein EOP61_37715 [Sphingomonadales bacterium]